MSVVLGREARAAPDPAAEPPAVQAMDQENSMAFELTRQGRAHASHGDDGLALRRFMEAIALDPTFGPAYVELGVLRERMGDWAEAARVYDTAISRLPAFGRAYRARADLRRRLGQNAEAEEDFEKAFHLAQDPTTLLDAAEYYISRREWPAALAAYRRLAATAAHRRDLDAQHRTGVQIRALGILCAELDPVRAGDSGRGWVRKALARMARQRGL